MVKLWTKNGIKQMFQDFAFNMSKKALKVAI